jgi:hypothetical protein
MIFCKTKYLHTNSELLTGCTSWSTENLLTPSKSSLTNSIIQHKVAAFNSMLLNVVNEPMSYEDFVAEQNFIFETAHLNRYGKEPIQKLHKKYMRKRCIKQHATLRLINKDTEKFFAKVTNKLVKIFSEQRIRLTYTNDGKLKNHLDSPKDKAPAQFIVAQFTTHNTVHKFHRAQFTAAQFPAHNSP